MNLLDNYFALQQKVHDYFGYREDWCIIPLSDDREYFWHLNGDGPGHVRFAGTEQELADRSGEYFWEEIYTQRHLPKWVYRAPLFTMICVDTHTDGNKLLRVFDNAKERP